MISHYPLLETAPFIEFTSVKVTDAFNHLFDIEKTQKKIYSLIANHLSIKFFNCTILKSKILLTIIVVLPKIQLTG